ncbi:MAG: 6-phosphofructokinase [Phycisphaerales bacterium JB039]
MPIQRIGLLTGGGDCPGLNAVIRASAKDAMGAGVEVWGVEDGFLGLIENRIRPLSYDDVSGILNAGGTILGASNKANPARFATGADAEGNPIWEDVTDRCMDNIRTHGLDALVVIGGDGTMTVAMTFVERGVPCVGVPKTIDNDLYGTDITFGFLTATAIATEALDRVHTTAASHHRAMVVEVMGRNSGWIALHAGVASGSDVILVPEIEFDMAHVCEVVEQRARRGRRYTVICVSEGAAPKGREQFVDRRDPTSPDPIRLGGVAKFVSDQIEDATGVESRHVVLGHVQRGGSPVAADRVLATRFGHAATTLLVEEGKTNRMVAQAGGKITHVDMAEAAGRQRKIPPDHSLVEAARAVGTSFGDR